MNKDIETLREAAQLFRDEYGGLAQEAARIDAIADRMEQQSKAEPVGSVHKDTLAMLPTLRYVDGGAKIWPPRKAKHDDAYTLVYSHPPADARDAERYRYLRKNPAMLLHLSNSKFDAAIDAAIAAKEGKE